MKKALVIVFSLLLLLSFVGCSNSTATPTAAASASAGGTQNAGATPTVAPSPTPASGKERISVSEGTVLINFEQGIDALAFVDLSSYGLFPPETEIATGEDVQSGQGLQFNINYTTAAGIFDAQFAGYGETIAAGMANAADYDYVRMWVSNNGDSDVSIAMLLIVSDASKNGCANPEDALLVDQYGESEEIYTTDAAAVNATNETGDTSVSVPAGFAGWVYFPLKSQVSWWEKTTLTEEELLTVDAITLDIRFDNVMDAEYLVIDDFCLANPEE